MHTKWKTLTSQQKELLILTYGENAERDFDKIMKDKHAKYLSKYSPKISKKMVAKLGMVVPPGIDEDQYVRESLPFYGPLINRKGKTGEVDSSADSEILDALRITPPYTNREELESQAVYFITGGIGFFVVEHGRTQLIAYGTLDNYHTYSISKLDKSLTVGKYGYSLLESGNISSEQIAQLETILIMYKGVIFHPSKRRIEKKIKQTAFNRLYPVGSELFEYFPSDITDIIGSMVGKGQKLKVDFNAEKSELSKVVPVLDIVNLISNFSGRNIIVTQIVNLKDGIFLVNVTGRILWVDQYTGKVVRFVNTQPNSTMIVIGDSLVISGDLGIVIRDLEDGRVIFSLETANPILSLSSLPFRKDSFAYFYKSSGTHNHLVIMDIKGKILAHSKLDVVTANRWKVWKIRGVNNGVIILSNVDGSTFFVLEDETLKERNRLEVSSKSEIFQGDSDTAFMTYEYPTDNPYITEITYKLEKDKPIDIDARRIYFDAMTFKHAVLDDSTYVILNSEGVIFTNIRGDTKHAFAIKHGKLLAVSNGITFIYTLNGDIWKVQDDTISLLTNIESKDVVLMEALDDEALAIYTASGKFYILY